VIAYVARWLRGRQPAEGNTRQFGVFGSKTMYAPFTPASGSTPFGDSPASWSAACFLELNVCPKSAIAVGPQIMRGGLDPPSHLR
jgi:hypothetical protein